MKKRILPMVMAIACLCTASTAFAAYKFNDISGEQYGWCAPQIEAMSDAGYINGYEDGTYRPDNEVTKLECISLFARVMGSADKNNADILDLAHSNYDSALKGSSLPWGEDELAYMMYKGALTAADLTTYINGDAKNKPMTRGEAAVIITKAMGGEIKATSQSAVSLHYKDAREIPSNILQYVKFVTDEGIMNGIDDAFCADGTVTRSQIAVMLSRVSEKCDYSFYKGRINDIDEDNAIVKYTINGKAQNELKISDDVKFFIRGEEAQVDSVPKNVAAVIQMSGDKIISIDAMSDKADEEVTAIFAGYTASSTTLTLRVKLSENASARTYTCDLDVPVTYQGSPATIKAIQSGDAIVLSMSDGKVVSISAVEKTSTVSAATVEEITVKDGVGYMTISSAVEEYNGVKYPISDTVTVTKNNNTADMTDIFVGDKVTLTVRYGQIVEIRATGTNKTIDGVIVSILVAENSEITLNVSGSKVTYKIPRDCEIVIGDKEGQIYDLRVGDNISLTVQSGAVLKVKSVASITNTTGRVSGTVAAVNPSFKFISVITEGSAEPVNVFINTSTKYVLQQGNTNNPSLSSIAVGDSVECYITPTNGAYVATLIVIDKAK